MWPKLTELERASVRSQSGPIGVSPLHGIPSVPSDPFRFRALPNPLVEASEAAFAFVSALLSLWPLS